MHARPFFSNASLQAWRGRVQPGEWSSVNRCCYSTDYTARPSICLLPARTPVPVSQDAHAILPLDICLCCSLSLRAPFPVTYKSLHTFHRVFRQLFLPNKENSTKKNTYTRTCQEEVQECKKIILYSLAGRQTAASRRCQTPLISQGTSFPRSTCTYWFVSGLLCERGLWGVSGWQTGWHGHVRLLLVIASFLFRKPQHGRTGRQAGGESPRDWMECEGKKINLTAENEETATVNLAPCRWIGCNESYPVFIWCSSSKSQTIKGCISCAIGRLWLAQLNLLWHFQ